MHGPFKLHSLVSPTSLGAVLGPCRSRPLKDPSWPLLYALLIPISHVRVSNMAKCFPIICTMFVP